MRVFFVAHPNALGHTKMIVSVKVGLGRSSEAESTRDIYLILIRKQIEQRNKTTIKRDTVQLNRPYSAFPHCPRMISSFYGDHRPPTGLRRDGVK